MAALYPPQTPGVPRSQSLECMQCTANSMVFGDEVTQALHRWSVMQEAIENLEETMVPMLKAQFDGNPALMVLCRTRVMDKLAEAVFEPEQYIKYVDYRGNIGSKRDEHKAFAKTYNSMYGKLGRRFKKLCVVVWGATEEKIRESRPDWFPPSVSSSSKKKDKEGDAATPGGQDSGSSDAPATPAAAPRTPSVVPLLLEAPTPLQSVPRLMPPPAAGRSVPPCVFADELDAMMEARGAEQDERDRTAEDDDFLAPESEEDEEEPTGPGITERMGQLSGLGRRAEPVSLGIPLTKAAMSSIASALGKMKPDDESSALMVIHEEDGSVHFFQDGALHKEAKLLKPATKVEKERVHCEACNKSIIASNLPRHLVSDAHAKKVERQARGGRRKKTAKIEADDEAEEPRASLTSDVVAESEGGDDGSVAEEPRASLTSDAGAESEEADLD